jgi:ATP-dependent DNA helicase RecQ
LSAADKMAADMVVADKSAPDKFAAALASFGLKNFRPGQRDIVESVLSGRDAIAVLPTGGGKSLCYQLPAVYSQKLVIVISPLIALMRDQVESLNRRGIAAGCLHSDQTEAEKTEIFQRMKKGGAFVLYLSPERAQKEGFQKWIVGREIALFAIDEAHCVSQWGHDFREEYGQLSILKRIRPDVPILALTASATPLVLDDIGRNLRLRAPSRHVHGFYRKNLYYQVVACEDDSDKMSYLLQALGQFPEGKVIIYCGTRKATEEVARYLSKSHRGVGFYHAGLGGEDRAMIQDAYASGKIRILAATNAFGMGVDHPDVRLVVHYQMPANIDSLYQEMGRAGRDGHDSTCIMLYSKKDKGLQSYFIQTSGAPAEIKNSRWNTLEALVAYAEGGECRHSEILTYYQDSQRIESCGHCDTCAPDSMRRVAVPEEEVEASGISSRSRRGKKSRRPRIRDSGEVMDGMEGERFTHLKEWRKAKAKALDVAAFMVFSDKTLRAIANQNPRSLDALLEIHGIGAAKAEAFGREVLDELKGM